MSFEGHRTKLSNSPFPTYQRQGSLNVGGGNDGNMAFSFSVPSGSLQDTASCRPWSHNPHNDPYGLINSVQSSIKNRKPDNMDCDGDTDLQSLVSNILDEADSQDCYYNEGCLPTCKSLWVPKTLREELLHYFQSEGQLQHNPSFTPNYLCPDPFKEAQGQCVVKDVEELGLYSRSPTSSQQWFFNLPNRDRDSCTPHPQNLPPGLSLNNKGNAYLSEMHNMSGDRGNSQPMNYFPEVSDVFRPPCEMNSRCFDPYYKDHYTQSSTEQCVPKDINQLVNSFQSFMPSEHNSFSHGDFSAIHKQTLDVHHEDGTGPPMPIQITPAVQTQKQVAREFGIVQRERNEGVRKQSFIHDDFQALPGFSQQNAEYFQQPKSFSASLNHPNQYQNNITMCKENSKMSISQYSNYNIQQGQMQNKFKRQLQENKKMTCMSDFLENGISARPRTNFRIREGEKKKTLAQSPCFHLQGSMQSQKYGGGNSIVHVGNKQQFMPLMYPVNYPRKSSSLPNNSKFSSRGTLPYGTGVAGMGVGDMVSASESAAFNSYADDMTCRGQSTANGMAPAVTASIMMNQGGPMIQLAFFLDECYEQWRRLEKERKRIEVVLTKIFPGKWTSAVTNSIQPKTPPNPTRVDNLIVKQIREEAKVASLLDRMESLYKNPLHMNIHTALNRHHTAISIIQARCEEISNVSKHQQQKAHLTEDSDTTLTFALKDLAATTRKLRTALWCALQMTLPKPVKREYHDFEVPTCNERCSSPFEGYCFRL